MLKKIAFIGSVGSGKTTIVENLSNIETINTDVKSSIDIGKETTTVGIDYGHLTIDENISLGLYGVPGQRKFSMIWDFVKEGLWAIVILIKNNDATSIDEFEHLIKYFEIDKRVPFIVGITHADLADSKDTVNQIKIKLSKFNLKSPIFSVDPRKTDSAMLIMNTLIALEEYK